jgi:TatD DNase family protein
MEFIDTHCHVHESEFADKFVDRAEVVLERAKTDGVNRFVCVGTTLVGSKEAADFANGRADCVASAALHPHEVQRVGVGSVLQEFAQLKRLVDENAKAFTAIGECGLDYFYHTDETDRDMQKQLLRAHLELAKAHNLPVIFHVREAFDAFWPIFDEFEGLTGVIHSFSATSAELQQILARGLYVGLNGIMTFTRDQKQLKAAKSVPLESLVLETDAPFLTPVPFRGTMCEPRHVRVTAEFLADLRGESLEDLAAATTHNARVLFSLE